MDARQAAAFLALLCAFVSAMAAVSLAGGRRRRDRIVGKPLLTPNETEFHGRLVAALPAHTVLAQVSMGALLSAGQGRGRFDRKVVDFVVCDEAMRVVALVELDDRTHSAKADRARDAMTRGAGYATLRYASKAKPSVSRIAADVAALDPR